MPSGAYPRASPLRRFERPLAERRPPGGTFLSNPYSMADVSPACCSSVVVVGRFEPASVPAVAEFARSLRDLRQAAGQPSINALAEASGCNGTTVWEALNGRRRPTRPVTLALVAALGGGPQLWGPRWDALDVVVQEARKPTVTRRGPDGTAVCQVDGCPNVARGRWCSTHRRHDDDLRRRPVLSPALPARPDGV